MPLKTASPFEQRYYQMFVGKQVKSFEFIHVDPDMAPIPTFTFTDGTFAQVWADPEGNGPGHLGLYCLKTGCELHPA